KTEVRAAEGVWAPLSGRPLCRKWRAHRPVSCDKKSDTSSGVPFVGLGGHRFRRSAFVRRADVRERREQVLVGTYLILLHLSIGEERKEEIYDVVGERPAIVRVRRRPRGIIVEDVRQHGRGDPRCFRRRISAAVLQRVREDGDKTGIARWLRSEIGGVLLAGKEGSLI